MTNVLDSWSQRFASSLRPKPLPLLKHACGEATAYHAGRQEVGRCHTRGEFSFHATLSQRTYIWAKPKKWQFLSPPLSTDLEGGTPSELMCPTQTISICLYTFSHRFAQNRSFYKLIFFNPINFYLKFHLKMVLEWWEHSFIVKNKK